MQYFPIQLSLCTESHTCPKYLPMSLLIVKCFTELVLGRAHIKRSSDHYPIIEKTNPHCYP